MRKRLFPAGAAIALALGLLTALPASAVYADPVIEFPGGSPEFYSPFSGPATVTFTFEATDNDATFEIRLRPQGGTAIRTKQVFIDPDSQSSPRVVQFSWPSLSVGSTRTYQVAVYRGGNLQGSPESFQLHPPLAVITGATPNPFLPWIIDGYKDTTRIRFTLDAGVTDAEARVFKANSNGKCCGSLIRDEQLGSLNPGSNFWDWNGQGEGGFAGTRPAGKYFVKIWADDGSAPPAISKPKKVSIVRTYRTTAIKTKPGTAYHHTTESALVRGGDCFVHAQGGYLQVDCHGGRMSVFYRFGLGSGQRIESASFVIDNANNECGPSRRAVGHMTHESFLTVTDSVSGITSCRIVTAKITYSYLEDS
jgi:hypothetical protein